MPWCLFDTETIGEFWYISKASLAAFQIDKILTEQYKISFFRLILIKLLWIWRPFNFYKEMLLYEKYFVDVLNFIFPVVTLLHMLKDSKYCLGKNGTPQEYFSEMALLTFWNNKIHLFFYMSFYSIYHLGAFILYCSELALCTMSQHNHRVMWLWLWLSSDLGNWETTAVGQAYSDCLKREQCICKPSFGILFGLLHKLQAVFTTLQLFRQLYALFSDKAACMCISIFYLLVSIAVIYNCIECVIAKLDLIYLIYWQIANYYLCTQYYWLVYLINSVHTSLCSVLNESLSKILDCLPKVFQ